MLFQNAQELFKRQITNAIALPVVLLLSLAGVFIWQINWLLSSLQWVEHTNEVISNANQIQKLLLDAETGIRGYQISGDLEFLEPYQSSQAQIRTAFDQLHSLVSDNPPQVQRVERLRSQQAQWIQNASQAVLRRQQNQEEPLAAIKSRKQQMDAMRRQIATFIGIEEALRKQRSETVQTITRFVIFTSVSLASGLGALLAYFIHRQLLAVSHTYRNALESLQENHNLLQSVIDGTTDAVFMKDHKGRYQLVNATTARIIGRPKVEILGKDDLELLPEVAKAIQEHDRYTLLLRRSQTIEEQVPQNGEVRTFLSTKDPYIDMQGNIAGIIGISRDITNRKQAEEQLRRSASRLAALQEIDRAILRSEHPLEIAAAAVSRLKQVIAYDQAAVVALELETNQAHILAGELAGNTASKRLPITDLAPLELFSDRPSTVYYDDLAALHEPIPVLQYHLAAGHRSFLAVALLVQDTLIGDLILLSRQPAAFGADEQEIAGEIANQLAIAIQQADLRTQLQYYASELEQRVAERTAQLQEINQELEAFTYTVSHDLRAPLRTIQGFAQALLEDYGDRLDEVAKSYIDSIVGDSIQLDTLIADLLTYSRLSRAQVNLQPTDLSSLVQEALKQLRMQIKNQQANITVREPLQAVLAQRSILVQAIANLISNAMKFVEPGTPPNVEIYTQKERQNDQNWVRLWVVDNGIGIAPEHQERIFHVFERLHGIESYSGTGVGLAIVRKGLERMGGRAGVESQLGQGSRFWIALPEAVLIPPSPSA